MIKTTFMQPRPQPKHTFWQTFKKKRNLQHGIKVYSVQLAKGIMVCLSFFFIVLCLTVITKDEFNDILLIVEGYRYFGPCSRLNIFVYDNVQYYCFKIEKTQLTEVYTFLSGGTYYTMI